MDGFNLNGRYIPWDRLERSDPKTTFEQSTLNFLQAWKSGEESFELTSSGSTGPPKHYTIPRQLLTASASQTIKYLHLKNTDHAFVCMNTAYIAGKMMLVRALEADMELTIVDPVMNPFANLTERPSFMAVVPLQLDEFFKNGSNLASNIKAILVGGAPLSMSLRKKASAYKVPIYETYGMTETLTHVALKKISGPTPDQHFSLLPGVEIRQNNEECLEIRSAVTRNQWVITNDRVAMQGKDKFIWLGRKDFVINSGGVKIHPEQVEKKLEVFFNDRGWTNRFLIGPIDNDKYGQTVTLFVEGKLPIEKDQLLDEIRYRLDAYEQPKQIVYVAEFPVGPSGKLDRLSTIAKGMY